MRTFWICFVPLFVAVDAIGVLPIFMGLCGGIAQQRRRVVIVQSMITAGVVAVVFLLAGVRLIELLGITVNDFMMAGGALLFVLSLRDLVTAEKSHGHVDVNTVGAVPIGVPLITGPAVLTTGVLLLNQHGAPVTIAAVVVNILIAGAIFWFASPISRFLGNAGTRTLSKIASLILASIAVMMIRKGVVGIIADAAGSR